MATTTNYSWTTPDDTDLVKDGAAAIRTLGTAIDTTVFTNAGAAIAKSIVDAKGDLIAGTADNTVARLAVGANDTILVADSSEATGLKWAAPAGGGKILQVVTTTDNTAKQLTPTAEYTELNTTITPSSASSKILIIVSFGLVSNSTQSDSGFRVIRDSTAIGQGTSGTVNITQSFFMGEGSSNGSGYTIHLVDSPATTSATTYKIDCLANTGTVNINRRGLDTYYATSSTMTLMEIGA
jgi:hypothetical protein